MDLLKLGLVESDVALSIGVFLLATAAAQVTAKVISRNQPLETKRFWQLTTRNVSVVIAVIALAAIWRTELQSVMVALGAAAVGIFLTFREAWLSMLSFWVRMVKRHYSVGDYIEIDGMRGRVLDITWMHTVLAETGAGQEAMPFTGRQIQVPNNRMLLSSLYVQNLTGAFTPHVVTFHLPLGAPVLVVESLILNLAVAHCEPFRLQAIEHMANFQQNHLIEAPSTEPKVNIVMVSEGFVSMHLRIVVPSKEKMKIGQAIMHDFFRQINLPCWSSPTEK